MQPNTAAQLRALEFYARINAALFPVPAGYKDPKTPEGVYIVPSWKHNYSTDPAQWRKWADENPGCNFGVIGCFSWLIIVDIDVPKVGRDAAWAVYCELCREWGIEPVMPHVESARGGWHVYFRIPAWCDPMALKQRDAVKGVINIRIVGYAIAAGSYYDGTPKGEASGVYTLINEADPYAAPQGLLDLCKPPPENDAGSIRVAQYKRDGVAQLLTWMMEHSLFHYYEEWTQTGMALKLAFGDEIGPILWELATWDKARDQIPTKWKSFATNPKLGLVTLRTVFKRAREAGWTGKVEETVDSMFGEALHQPEAHTVADLAANSGAQLPPGPSNVSNANRDESAALCAARGAKQVEFWQPILDQFLTSREYPLRPMSAGYPTVPELASHPLADYMRACVDRLVAYGETARSKFKTNRVTDILAILQIVHDETYKAIVRYLRNLECNINERTVSTRVIGLETEIENAVTPVVGWQKDVKNQIITNCTDNVEIYLESIGVQVRWNAWLDCIEIVGWKWTDWTLLDDAAIDVLLARAHRKQTDFGVSKDFLWSTLRAIAKENVQDPAIEELDRLAALWDGESRLVTWISHATGLDCTPYHQALGKFLIGSMVRRIREPGCKQDYVVVFWGPEGTGKSSLAQLLAPRPAWFTDSVKLGEEPKELVGLLAGKAVVEFSEMAVRGQKEHEHVKAMISMQVDEGRRAYDRVVTKRPRRNIFIGTSNPPPLTDSGANRRFFPVHVEQAINLDWLTANREQLIGEAAALYAQGYRFDLPIELRQIASEQREEARAISSLEASLSHWLGETDITRQVPWTYITGRDLHALCEFDRVKYNNASLSDTMKRVGFKHIKLTVDGKQQWSWVRGKEALSAWIVQNGIRYVVTDKGAQMIMPGARPPGA